MTVFGLPLHPLIVHATVVAVPVAAIAVLLATFWPRFRRWASWGPLAAAALAMILVPITTSSGESLEHSLPRSALIEKHAHLADGLLVESDERRLLDHHHQRRLASPDDGDPVLRASGR